jgi:phenylpyruvate tautomerase PptA (4-oxalocrotonate tautomerase family)
MAQVKIYGLAQHLDENREQISEAIHASVMSAFEYPPEKKFHRFISLKNSDFVYPDDRSEAYTIIELSIFEGRSEQAKKALIKTLFSNLEQSVGITPQDIEITIFETPKANWGIRGKPGDELALNYKVEV